MNTTDIENSALMSGDMFRPGHYMTFLVSLLGSAFGERLLYAGLQGSYLRGEASAHSDIDVMIVIRELTTADLSVYRQAIEALPSADKSCGFICGEKELRHWNPLEICHLLHTTRDYFGTLSELVPEYSRQDVIDYVKLSLGNLYHEITHRFVHASREQNEAALPAAYKSVFYILQNLHYLDSGCFRSTKQELLSTVSGMDRQVLETALSFGNSKSIDFDAAFSLLHAWCREALVRTSSLAGKAL